jgi:hypothetical protein
MGTMSIAGNKQVQDLEMSREKNGQLANKFVQKLFQANGSS